MERSSGHGLFNRSSLSTTSAPKNDFSSPFELKFRVTSNVVNEECQMRKNISHYVDSRDLEHLALQCMKEKRVLRIAGRHGKTFA